MSRLFSLLVCFPVCFESGAPSAAFCSSRRHVCDLWKLISGISSRLPGLNQAVWALGYSTLINLTVLLNINQFSSLVFIFFIHFNQGDSNPQYFITRATFHPFSCLLVEKLEHVSVISAIGTLGLQWNRAAFLSFKAPAVWLFNNNNIPGNSQVTRFLVIRRKLQSFKGCGQCCSHHISVYNSASGNQLIMSSKHNVSKPASSSCHFLQLLLSW